MSAVAVACSAFQLAPRTLAPIAGSPTTIPSKSFRVLFGLQESLAAAGRAAGEIGVCRITAEGLRDGFTRDGAHVHATKQPIVLLGHIIERPTTVQERKITTALVAGISNRCGKPSTDLVLEWKRVEQIEKDSTEIEAPSEPAVADKEKSPIPRDWQAELKIYLIGPWIIGGYVSPHITIGDRI